MKTIEHKGKTYQVGELYEFSRFGENWFVDVLGGIDQGATYPYKVRTQSYKFIRVCKANLGTIEDAPVELIDGECYSFTDRLVNERKGFFSAEHDTFYRAGGWSCRSECTNIKLLTVGEQK